MLFEYAIVPDVFDPGVVNADGPSERLLTLLEQIVVNGMIADLHKSRWRRHVKERLEACPESQTRSDVMELLSILDAGNRLVRHPRAMNGDPGTDQAWLDLALLSHGNQNFDMILAEAQHEVPDDAKAFFYLLKNFRRSQRWKDAKASAPRVKNTITEMGACLRPVLRHAKQVTIIDPFFDVFKSKVQNSLGSYLEMIGDRGLGPVEKRNFHATIDIHMWHGGIDGSPASQVRAWKNRFLELKQEYPKFSFSVSVWKRSPSGGPKMHDRYIVTQQCSVTIGAGLDLLPDDHADAQTTTCSLHSEEDRQAILAEYSPTTSPFELEAPDGHVRVS